MVYVYNVNIKVECVIKVVYEVLISVSLWSFLCNGDFCSLSTAVSMICFTNVSKNHYCNYNIKVCVQVKPEKATKKNEKAPMLVVTHFIKF